MELKLSKKDLRTVSKIVANKAIEMRKRGAVWARGEERLSCVEMGKLANKILKPTGEFYDFDGFFKEQDKPKSKRGRTG